jgi:hypothetical protein
VLRGVLVVLSGLLMVLGRLPMVLCALVCHSESPKFVMTCGVCVTDRSASARARNAWVSLCFEYGRRR